MENYTVEELQGAGLALSLASRLIYLEPSQELIRPLVEDRVFDEVPFGEEDFYVRRGLSQLQEWCDETANASDGLEDRVGDLQREWLLVFVGLGSPRAPSWASFYTDPGSRILAADTLKARAWYRRFGLQAENLNHEPDDNIGLMLAFLSHLVSAEAEADSDSPWSAEELQDAQKEFMAECLLPWLPAWHANATRESKSSFFKGVSDLIFGICIAYSARFGIRYDSSQGIFAFASE